DAAVAAERRVSTLTSGPSWLENTAVRVDAAADGSLRLTDKRTGRVFGPLNVFRSEADRGDEYSFCPAAADRPVSSLGGAATVTLVEEGPLRATLEIQLTLAVPAGLAHERDHRVTDVVALPIRTRVSLSPDRARLEIQTTLENTARDHRLRALFTTGVQTEYADAQGQFQVMRRLAALDPAERARVPEFDEEQEVSYHPQRAFVDVSDADGGLAVLNRGLPEYEAEVEPEGICLALTLLRAVGWLSREDLSTRYKHAGPALETPEAQCLGPHTFEYAVLPHSGDWLAGGVPPEAEAYVTPVWSAPLGSADGSLPAAAGFYALEPAELLFSTCKRSEDGRALVLRGYNTAPHPLTATLRLGMPARVLRANLAERPAAAPLPATEPGVYTLDVRPHEIVTFAIYPEEAR
ncbi:MAG TPA: glycoside hydrolase family 38 C-terminal domain-containing protein, partial [Chloroflexia bacterium]|nr:glycoside hydrolase family 38 C-terminal domain-containing protein [Chloroflexia bacterium]